MSFLTLKSEVQASGRTQNTADGANNFVNNFNDPLIIAPGDTLELVSCSINRPDTIVIGTTNNEFVFRRGYGLDNAPDITDLNFESTRFSQHLVKVPLGTYTGTQLAAELTTQLDRNTLLYPYDGTWVVDFTPAVAPDPANFQFIISAPGLNPVVQLTMDPSREEELFLDLDPTKNTDPITDVTELVNQSYTDPFIKTDPVFGRSPNDSKLNLKIGLEGSGYIHGADGYSSLEVKPVSICDDFDLEDAPPGRPYGRVLTFDLPGLGTIDNLNTTGNLNIISAGGPSDYTSGEAVYLEFATPDPFRPQRVGAGIYGVEYVTATAVVDPLTNLLSGLVRTGNPKLGYNSLDIFVVLKVGGGSPISPATVSVNTAVTGITDIDGSFYNDAVLNGLIAITQIPLGADPTAFGAEVFVNANVVGIGELTAAEITPAESDIMSTTNGVFTPGDLFIVDSGDVNGLIGVATITPVPAVGDQFLIKSWENDLGNDYVVTPEPLIPATVQGWNHIALIDEQLWYMYIHEDAALVMTLDPDNTIYAAGGNLWFKAVADPVELAVGNPFSTSCTWQREYLEDDPPPEDNLTTISLTQDSGVTSTSVPLTFTTTYPKVQLAFSKHQMLKSATETDNPEERYTQVRSDLNVTVRGDLSDPAVPVVRMTATQQYGGFNGISFPEEDWSNQEEIYDDEVVPFFTGFSYGESTIVLYLQVEDIFNPVCQVAWKSHIDGAAAPSVDIINDTGADPATPNIPPFYVSLVREHYYPMKVVMFYGEAYPFNIEALELVNPGGAFGQTRLSFEVQGYNENSSTWREENRNNVLWELPNPDDESDNWNDNQLQVIQPGYTPSNVPIVFKFDKIKQADIQYPDGVTVLPPTQASGLISVFDSAPGGALVDDRLYYTPAYPNINNGIGPTIGMPNFYQDPTPAPVTGFAGDDQLIVAPRQTIQVEIPEFNTKSWSGGSNDVGRAVGVIPAEQWENNAELANDTLFYKSDYPKPINLNSQVTQPMYSLTCRLRDTEGRLIEDLKNPTTVTFLVKEGDEAVQQRIMTRALERVSAMKANSQEERISTANENMPRF